MERRKILGVMLASALIAAQSASADFITLGAAKDNTLYQDAGSALSNGAGQHFFAGRTGSGALRRGLLAFDVASAVPADSTIVSVSLTLHMSQTSGGLTAIGLHQVLANWGEGTSDAEMNEGGGAPATPGDATWLHTFHDTELWSTPGGDFDPLASASLGVNAVGFHTWATTPALVADVQGWLDDPASNFCWLLQGDESVNSTTKRFDSRQNPTESFRPRLTIEYLPVPEPAMLATLVVGWCAARRRRRL